MISLISFECRKDVKIEPYNPYPFKGVLYNTTPITGYIKVIEGESQVAKILNINSLSYQCFFSCYGDSLFYSDSLGLTFKFNIFDTFYFNCRLPKENELGTGPIQANFFGPIDQGYITNIRK